MKSCMLKLLVFIWCCAAGLMMPAHVQAEGSNVLFIFDASGSMKKKVDDTTRIDAAKKAMAEALKDLPADVRLGLVLYGHRKAKDCTDIELVSPIGADDAGKISSIISAVKVKGETPIAGALQFAARSFAALKGQSNTIVLVTDGIEECGGDPCAAAKAIHDAGLDLKVNIVGFTLNDQQRKSVQCIADETGGTYYDAKNAKSLGTALNAVKQTMVVPVLSNPPVFNLLSTANGGSLAAAPSREWQTLISNPEPYDQPNYVHYTHDVPSEAVFAFKNNQQATFSRFDFYVPEASTANLKDFELSVSDSLTGDYKTLGKFTTQNTRLLDSPYQSFTFPEATARYLKFRVLSTHGGGTPLYLFPIRVVGKLVDGSEVPPAAYGPVEGQINLASMANGGKMISASLPEWAGAIAQAEDYTATGYITYTHQLPSEAVISFKDGKSATFDKFAWLVPVSTTANVKEFELLAGDAVDGSFQSLGTFTTQNTFFPATPYQEFSFPAVTAKFFKVRLLSARSGQTPVYIEPFKLWGALN